ncbi:syntaxin-binding protein 5-like isoform X2 [Uloborus diversus]|uniref:syntaxin-binding protein 5-like isoform X2 n=1 Tax=Uloborus diversus TaxID=327109 RepID=UPI0024093F89|nr:syntaxin-binding protein 5-like isoform X2 [Uloborus diversus]
MKRLKGVLDGLRPGSSGYQTPKDKSDHHSTLDNAAESGSASGNAAADIDTVQEQLRPDHFKLAKTVLHGFPYHPTAVAFDPIQRLLAIGTHSGSLRIFGRPGVECFMEHSEFPILQLLFLINEGALVTVTGDDYLHMCNIRQKNPEIAQSLKFQKERLTHCHLPFQSKWLYAGTDKGNVHLVNVESFTLSGYIIYWNKAVELTCKIHPGAVVHLSENPLDANKLLIGFERGLVVLWDLRNKAADARFNSSESTSLKSVTWQLEGRQFLCSQGEGSLTTWNVKVANKPVSVVYPHAKSLIDGKPEPCNGIYKVESKVNRAGEVFTVFSGGLPYEEQGKTSSLTIQQGRSTTVLEMDYSIVDFVMLCEAPWNTEYQEPYAIVVLLERDLVLVDLTSPGFPCFQNPYPMDFHKSPVTYCAYYADCPNDLIPAFYSVGSMGTKQCGCSDKDWPLDGGEWGTATLSYPEIVITGHADGSLQFWDASSVSFQVLYKLKTTKVFERPKPRSIDELDEDPFAIDNVAFCLNTRLLAVAGSSGHVVVYNFKKNDASIDLNVLEISIKGDVETNSGASEENDPLNRAFSFSASNRSNSEDSGKQGSQSENYFPLRVRSGPVRMAAGFHAHLVCLTTGVEGEPQPKITALAMQSSYGLMAYGNERGLAIVDVLQKTCLLNMATADLYGSADPYQRPPKSPRRTSGCVNSSCDQDQGHSPCEESDGSCLSPTSRSHPHRRSLHSHEMRHARSQEKFENNFSRSRSSSTSSIKDVNPDEANNSEFVVFLRFCESYGGKTDSCPSPSLWVGTSLGSVLVFLLILPPPGDTRLLQPVIISPSGTIYRLKGGIINVSFLDSSGNVIGDSNDPSKEKDKEEKKIKLTSRPSSSSLDRREKQFAVLTSERRSHVVLLPSQTGVYRNIISDTSYAVKADVTSLKDLGSSLICYIATGHVNIYSLPSLRQLHHVDFLPALNMRNFSRMARTFCISVNGHGLYLSSPSEVQKFNLAASFGNLLQDMMGTLFLTKEMPEPPKQGFFKGLFGGGPSILDKEELFGEASGKSSKTVARHYPGGTVEQVKAQSSSLAGDVLRARQALNERGEQLGKLEDTTVHMMTEAEILSDKSQQLLLKYRDKKWYQL